MIAKQTDLPGERQRKRRTPSEERAQRRERGLVGDDGDVRRAGRELCAKHLGRDVARKAWDHRDGAQIVHSVGEELGGLYARCAGAREDGRQLGGFVLFDPRSNGTGPLAAFDRQKPGALGAVVRGVVQARAANQKDVHGADCSSYPRAMRLPLAACAFSLCLATSGFALAASPPIDCPIGSTGKAEGENTWCEPSVCETEAQCSPGQVCREVPLCIQVGTLDKADAGAKLAAPTAGSTRLLAISRCGENRKCAADAVCSDKKRCVDRGAADRMTAPLPMPSTASSAAAPEAKKSACGCHTPGAPQRGTGAALLGGLLALGLVVRRRRPS